MAVIITENDTVKEYKLKPCPFCGSEVKLHKDKLWYDHGGGYPGCYEYNIHCENPDCQCKIFVHKNNTIYWSDEEAAKSMIEAWNRRAE